MRRAIGFALCVALLAGCGVMLDGAYLLGDRKSTRRLEESAPTERTTERVEYGARLATDGTGALDLECTERERAIERRWDVVKTYRRRGSYSKDAYTATAVIDGLVGGTAAVIILAACNQSDAKLSCLNALYTTPFAIDLGYSLIRRSTARPDVLIDKYKTTDSLRLAVAPLRERATGCESIASLWLGHATGPSDEDILKGYGEGRARKLRDGAIPLRFDKTPTTELPPEAASLWLASPRAKMWALDARGVPHEIEGDRCAILRRHAHLATMETRKRFNEACPVKQR